MESGWWWSEVTADAPSFHDVEHRTEVRGSPLLMAWRSEDNRYILKTIAIFYEDAWMSY